MNHTFQFEQLSFNNGENANRHFEWGMSNRFCHFLLWQIKGSAEKDEKMFSSCWEQTLHAKSDIYIHVKASYEVVQFFLIRVLHASAYLNTLLLQMSWNYTWDTYDSDLYNN